MLWNGVLSEGPSPPEHKMLCFRKESFPKHIIYVPCGQACASHNQICHWVFYLCLYLLCQMCSTNREIVTFFVLWPQSLIMPSLWQLFYLWRKIACLPWVFTSDWCRQICSTLNAAHKKNIECWICPTFQILWLTRKIYVPPWNLHCLLLRNVKSCFPWVITFHTNPKDAYWRKTISPLLTALSSHGCCMFFSVCVNSGFPRHRTTNRGFPFSTLWDIYGANFLKPSQIELPLTKTC